MILEFRGDDAGMRCEVDRQRSWGCIALRLNWRSGCAGMKAIVPPPCVDETYAKVGGRWKYLLRAVDKHGRLIDLCWQIAAVLGQPIVSWAKR